MLLRCHWIAASQKETHKPSLVLLSTIVQQTGQFQINMSAFYLREKHFEHISATHKKINLSRQYFSLSLRNFVERKLCYIPRQ